MVLKFCFIIILFICQSASQEYLWPVQAEKALTAVFGEERPGRYHTGMDVRTFGEIGYKLIAIEEGYISRIRTSSKGYGKTIYLTLSDGNTAVYAHLDHFTPELDNLASALHQHYGKYTIDHKIKPEDYPIKKGDLIGYSGDTGGVSGPHLHFEIRDKENQPINPFQGSLTITDDIYPIAVSLAIIPLNKDARVSGYPTTQVFPLTKINDREYALADTIPVSGSIGLAIEAYDKISGQYFNFGIYSINLLLNAQFIYSMQYDLINWENASDIYTEKSFHLNRDGLGKYYHLFSHHHNQRLPFINSKSRPGFTFNSPGLNDAIINVQDYAGNKIEIKAFFSSDSLPVYNYTTSFSKSSCRINFDTDQELLPLFYLTGKYQDDHVYPTEYYDMGGNSYLIENILHPYSVLQITAKDSRGIPSQTSYHMKPSEDKESVEGDLILKHYEQGLIVTFQEEVFSGLASYISLEKEGIDYKYDLRRTSKLTHSSQLFSPIELALVNEIRVYFEGSTPKEVFKLKLSGDLVLPDSSFNFKLLGERLIVSGNPETFYDSTFIWAKQAEAPIPKEGRIITGPYFLKPYLIPFNKEIQLDFILNANQLSNRLGIYYLNQKKSEWNYLPTTIMEDSLLIRTSILSGEIFAVIEEKNPPKLSGFTPDIGGTYYSKDLEHLSFNVQDTFSGLEGEKDVIVELDGKPIIFEYNSYQNKVRYPLKYNLEKGMHTLYVQASDKVGNQSIVEGEFYIK